MKKITWEMFGFCAVYCTGLIVLAALAIWLLYQTFVAVGYVISWFCKQIDPIFGILAICAIGLAALCGLPVKCKAETRR